jgi:hypothetical protein
MHMQWILGALSLGVKRPGREGDHSTPSSAEVKDAWSCTSAPDLLKEAQGQLYFTFMHGNLPPHSIYESVSKRFRTGRLERECK